MAHTASGAQLELFSGFPVKITIFEGPLDLLLHLVARQQVDVQEVRLAEVTEGYLRYVRAMQELSIELSGEFLVMAAHLMLIKSRSLLPVSRAQGVAQAEEDPAQIEAKIQEQLAEYRIYKEAARSLEESRRARQRIYLRPVGETEGLGAGFVPLGEVSVFDIVSAVTGMLERARPARAARLERPVLSVGQRARQMAELLQRRDGPAAFGELVDAPESRLHIIITFLALLELIRQRRVRVRLDRRGAAGILVELSDAVATAESLPNTEIQHLP